VASLAVLFVAQHLPKRYFGAITLSILAAFGHIAGQLLVVRLWLIPQAGVLYLVPIFALAALFFGCINGFIVARLLDER
jgi:heptaprenyl diphosphate synthase